MAEQTLTEQIGATPGKIAIAVVLSGIFVSLLIMQIDDGTSVAGDVLEPGGPGTATIASLGTAAPEATVPSVSKPRPWPDVSLAEARKYNPFFMPRAAGASGWNSRDSQAAEALKQKDLQQRAEMRRLALTKLREQGVGVVLQSGEELVAIIGSDTVHIGDVIDGFKVVGIGRDGVTLEPDDPQ